MKLHVRTVFMALAVVSVLGLTVVLGGGTVQAALSCGDTITSDLTLSADLDCSSISGTDEALIVGAGSITIDLGGFEVIGPDSVSSKCPAFFADTTNRTRGIVIDGFDDVTVTNGAVTGFERGIRVIDAVGIKINNIEAYNNAFSAARVRENSEVALNNVYFHDNLNDAMGVSSGSSITLTNSRFVDNCASGIFLFEATADIKYTDFTGNFRSAFNYWQSNGSAENNFLQGNNSDSTASGSSDFGQISVTNHGVTGDVLLSCNEIRDSVDANGGAIERAIGVRRSLAPGGDVFINKNLIVDNPTGVWFSRDGTFAPVEMHENTFDGNVLAIDFDDSGADDWTVDATSNNFGTDPFDAGGGTNVLTTIPIISTEFNCGVVGDNGLRGHWPLDETTLGTVFDVSGNGNNGSHLGNPTPGVTGIVDEALELTSNKQGVQIPASASLDDAYDLSLLFCFSADDLGQKSKGRIFVKEDSFKINFSNQDEKLYATFERWSGKTGKWRWDTDQELDEGEHCGAVTYSYGSTSNQPELVLDGELITDRDRLRKPSGSVVSDAGMDIFLGNSEDRNRTFDGFLDDFYFFDSILTLEEIQGIQVIVP